MRLLVTGATGFLGSTLVPLLRAGDQRGFLWRNHWRSFSGRRDAV